MPVIQSIFKACWNGRLLASGQQQCKHPRTILSIPTEVRASLHADGLIVLHTRKGLVFRSNLTGARIWRGIAAGLSVSEIAGGLSEEFGEPFVSTLSHTGDFIAALKHKGLVIDGPGVGR